MNPNMLNRRSMLTGGTLISLSTLLAACVPHDITTAGDGSTASGAAATSGSSSSSAGNNASNGEYRKADAKGPAQNVP
ncbi:MAG: preprotein translocase YidC, partial [Kingella sp. (in: b-proteobacteria)]